MSLLTKVVVRLVADLAEYEKGLQQASKKTTSWAGGLSKTGKRLTVGLTGPILSFLGYATDSASDLYESVNKVEVVFGDASDGVIAFARNADTALGMSSQVALEAAATYGNLFEGAGMAEDAAADMSMELVNLAADLASFNNLDPSEVLHKLQSGLVGEVVPLRSLGINLSAAAVKAKAMAMGLAETEEALTPAMLMQARYALILEQTQNAQGDFARTSKGVANSTRIVRAQLVNLAAKLGNVLLPYAMRFLNIIKDWLSWLTGLDDTTRNWIVGIMVAAAALGPLLVIIGSVAGAISNLGPLISGLGTLMGSTLFWPIVLIVGALSLLAVAWKNNWGGIRDKAAAVWAWLQPMLAKLAQWLGETAVLATQKMAVIWNTALAPALTVVGQFLSGTLWPLFQVIGAWLVGAGATGVRLFGVVWDTVLGPALKVVWRILSELLWPIFKVVGRFIRAVFIVQFRILAALFDTYLAPAIAAVVEWMGDRLQPIFEGVSGFLKTVFLPIWDKLNGAITKIRDALGGLISKLSEFAAKLEKLSLPDWLTPGSPTPWEISLWGLNKALRAVASQGLPRMNAQLQVAYAYSSVPDLDGEVPGSVVGRVAGTARSTQVNFTYAPAVSLGDRVEAERVIAPLIEEKIREAQR